MGIVNQIQTLLNDVGVFWPLTQQLDAVNEAQMWAFAQTKWSRMSFPLNLVAGTDLYTLPTNLLVPGWIETLIQNSDGTISKTRAFPTTHRELEHNLRTWRGQAPAQPGYFVIWDAFTLRVFPRPDKNYIYTLWGVGFPTEILDASGDITAPATYYQAVVNYAMSLILEATRPDLADAYQAQAQEQLGAFRKHLRNYQSHNIRRLRPGSVSISGGRISTPNNAGRFDLQQGGSIAALPTYYPLES